MAEQSDDGQRQLQQALKDFDAVIDFWKQNKQIRVVIQEPNVDTSSSLFSVSKQRDDFLDLLNAKIEEAKQLRDTKDSDINKAIRINQITQEINNVGTGVEQSLQKIHQGEMPGRTLIRPDDEQDKLHPEQSRKIEQQYRNTYIFNPTKGKQIQSLRPDEERLINQTLSELK